MRVHQVVETLPVWSPDGDTLAALRYVARHGLPGLAVADPVTARPMVLGQVDLMDLLLPPYVRDDPVLADVYNELHADTLAAALSGTRVGDAIRTPIPTEVLAPDATLIQAVRAMTRSRRPLVPVGAGAVGGTVPPGLRPGIPVVSAAGLLRALSLRSLVATR